MEAILDHWQLRKGSGILDPFVGAGTTLVVARERGLKALGFDVSPLAVLASNVKVRDYDVRELGDALRTILRQVLMARPPNGVVSRRLGRAFSPLELASLFSLRNAINTQRGAIREFMLLALLSAARQFSRAAADGGWFRWVEKPCEGSRVVPAFRTQVEQMMADIECSGPSGRGTGVLAILKDARDAAHQGRRRYEAVITSPPYPNRHDYTRVFHIELLLIGLSESEIFDLRHGSLRSNVEGRRPELKSVGYRAPSRLEALLRRWPRSADARIPRMLAGYFEDLYLGLVGLSKLLTNGGRAAFVLGNVRHAGILIPVDNVFVRIAEQAGFEHAGTWVIRERGNSAQQMGKFGRQPSRESVVLLRKSE